MNFKSKIFIGSIIGICLFIFVALFYIYRPVKNRIFSSLRSIQEYAESLDEFPDADNITQLIDWLDPSYKSFHKKHSPGFFSRFLINFGVQRPHWHIYGFKELLASVTTQRLSKGYKGRFVQKIVPSSNDSFFIWGNLHGAFHSLVRDLQKLKNLGIIDDSLKIVNERYSFIFIGDIIDYSPFILETLTLVLRIMHANPDRVFYLRGDHEDKGKWVKFALRDELEIRARYILDEEIPFGQEMNAFFDTLPLALYLPSKEDSKVDLLRISRFDLGDKTLKEKRFAHFFASVDSIHYLDQDADKNVETKAKKSSKLKAVITIKHWAISAEGGEVWGSEFYPYGGLQYLGSKKDIARWAILSAPTNTSRRLFNFHSDSFVQLNITNGINDWKMNVYNRDIRSDENMFKIETVYLIPKDLRQGEAVEQKIKLVKNLHIGTTMDLSGVYKIYSQHYKDGMMLAIKEINNRGGVNGRFIDLTVLDDGYNPKKALDNIKSLLKQDIDIIVGSFGSPVLRGYLDLVRGKKVVSLFPFTGEMFARQRDLDFIINFIPPYTAEGFLLAEYAYDVLKTKNILFYYNPSVTGDVEAAEFRLKSTDVTITKIPYVKEDDPNKEARYNRIIREVTQKNPDAIMFMCPPKAAKILLDRLGLSRIKEKNLLGMSDLSGITFLNYIEAKGLSFVYTTFLPDAKTSQDLIAQEFRRIAQENGFVLNPESFLGYVVVKLFAYIVDRVDEKITKNSIISSAELIKNINFKGLKINFNSDLRQLSHTLWLVKGDKREEYRIKRDGENITTEKV